MGRLVWKSYADPNFLSFAAQAHAWHAEIRSERKEFVLLDAASGADGHVQVNNRARLAQEATGWMDEVFA